jgi:hypothetical protein
MAVIAREKIAAALRKKGFRESDRDHEYWFFYHLDKKTSIFTKLSYGTGYKDYGDDLLKKVRTQLRLSKRQLSELVECRIDEAAYTKILLQSGCLL